MFFYIVIEATNNKSNKIGQSKFIFNNCRRQLLCHPTTFREYFE